MSRYNFLRKLDKIQSPVDSVQIQLYDILNVDWKSFKFSSGYKLYTITKTDAQKPWLICYNNNIDYTYEDVLFLINGISDLFTGLVPGTTIKIPEIADIKVFLNSIVQ